MSSICKHDVYDCSSHGDIHDDHDDSSTSSYASLEDKIATNMAKEIVGGRYGQLESKSARQMNTSEIATLLMNVRLADGYTSSSQPMLNNSESNRESMTVEVISSSNESTATYDTNAKSRDPQEILQHILIQNGYQQDPIPLKDIPKEFFLEMTDENLESYTNETINAVRTKDIKTLQEYIVEGKNLQCCNQFGESIISLACRKGLTEVVDFLLNKANVSIQICDDYGRTPLHDACWTLNPDYKLIEMLISKCSDLLLICDKRGHTPLQYAHKEQYEHWCSFLWKNKNLIQPTVLGKRTVMSDI
jgi:hypothetical protein